MGTLLLRLSIVSCVDEHVLDANPSVFCKSGCLVVAAVLAPPAVVCFKQYVCNHCSRAAAVATCSLFGPSERLSHSFIFSSVFGTHGDDGQPRHLSERRERDRGEPWVEGGGRQCCGSKKWRWPIRWTI